MNDAADPFAAAAAGHAKRAIRLFERLMASTQVNGAHLIRYAALLQHCGRHEEAIAAFRKARTRRMNVEGRSLAYSGEAGSQAKLGALGRASRALRRSIGLEPRPGTLTLLAVNIIDRQGWNAEARRCLERALAIDADYHEAHYNLGCYYRKREQFERAEHHLRRAIEIDPRYAEAYAELGFCVGRDPTRATESRRLLSRSIRADPKYGWSRIYLAQAYWRDDDLRNAEKQYRAAVAVWPKTMVAHVTYGDFLSSTGDHRRGGERLRRALALAPSSDIPHYFYALHLYRLGRISGAVRSMRRAEQLGHGLAGKWLSDRLCIPERAPMPKKP